MASLPFGKKSAASLLAVGVGIASLVSDSKAAPAKDAVSFNNQIQPILSEYCYHCHGPDSAARKPKKHPLRLDKEQFAFEPRDDGKPVIVKGDPKASELVRRISAKDDDIMPPASEHKTVKPEEIALVIKWISEGAKYEKHWSLIPPTRPELQGTAGKGWSSQPIDRLVAQKLEQAGLKPNPAEDRARLFRRLSFDLTGLPPEPEALEQFVKDGSPKTYEQAVDTMLASDASAEHFTRLWLDAVRYADTQGIHHDHSRSIWPYRDWVIAAFKNNMPFDEFTVDQIAGDLLPNPTMDQKIASGYNRLLPTTGEGGAIPDEYAAIYAKDRTETTTAVWLGLTSGCATCHDHKFDPITTREFYSLTAFFRNNTQPALDSPTSGNVAPMLFVPAKEDRLRWDALEKDISSHTGALEQRKKVANPDFEKWIASQASSETASTTHKIPLLLLPLNEGNGPCRGTFQGSEIAWAGAKESHAGPFGSAPLVAGGEPVTNARPALARHGGASFGAYIYIEGKPNGAIFSRMDRSANYRGWDLFFTEGRPTVHIIDKWPDMALKVTAKQPLKSGQWHHVLAVFDGQKKGADALAIFVDGRRAEVDVNNNNLGPNLETDAPLRLGGRSEKDGPVDTLNGGKVFAQNLVFFGEALGPVDIARLATVGLVRDLVAGSNRSAEKTNALFDLYLEGHDTPSQRIRDELAALKSEEGRIKERGATTLIYEEKKDSEPVAYVLLRGNYTTKGDKVSPTTPAALPPMPADQPRNRLGLARWLVAPENPLMARVTMNRIWSHLMGIGIVETTEDLGVMGARPSNQPLLDWLAVEFKDSGWNFRHMVKTMVMSATYQQAEAASREKIEKDPQNRLFARGPRVRLDAEEIRDQALAASGLLVPKVGGPPVKPYQPEGVWESVAMKDSNTRNYVQDHGEALYRRSLYTFWKRVAPPPSMEILNAPSREVFCTRRDRTDTPLQAFVTMNDPQFIEAARQLAARALESEKTFDGRLDKVTERLLGRRFKPAEREAVKKLEARALQDYQKDASAAKELIGVGESKAGEKLPAPELAAWTLVASQVMNLDESLTK